MGGLEVHEHQLFTIFSEGSHLVGVHADPVHTCQEVSGDAAPIDVEGNDVRRPTTYLQRKSANGDQIEVEGHHAHLRITVSQSLKTR